MAYLIFPFFHVPYGLSSIFHAVPSAAKVYLDHCSNPSKQDVAFLALELKGYAYHIVFK